jgi:hypothetical protein
MFTRSFGKNIDDLKIIREVNNDMLIAGIIFCATEILIFVFKLLVAYDVAKNLFGGGGVPTLDEHGESIRQFARSLVKVKRRHRHELS